MCGIVGFINKRNKKSDFQLLKSMTKSIKHRGPDSINYIKSKNFYFGHTRLSIIDQNKSSQPIISDLGNILIYNGEILNFKDLKKKFFKKKKFKTNGDTEVLLYGLETQGIKFLKEVRGFFSFAYFSKSNNRILIGRDQMAIKPLYYYRDKKNFVFCSEIKPILKYKKFKPNLNKNIIFEYLCRSIPPYLHTFYKDIFEVEAGSVLEINLKNLDIKKIKFFKLDEEWKKESKTKNEYQALTRIKKIFNRNLKRYFISDVNRGVMLSQGLDSSLIYYKFKKKYKNKISSLTYNNSHDYSEGKIVKSLLKKFNPNKKVEQNNYFKLVSRKKIIQKFKKGIIDFPLNYQFAFSMLDLYSLAKKKKIKVLYTGQGADELFFGYDRFYSIEKTKKPSIKNIFYGNGYKNIKIVERITNYKSTIFEKESYAIKWLKYSKLNFQKKMLIFDQKFRLPSLLNLDDFMSMQKSVEVRPFFLDLDLVNYVNSIDEKFKINENKRKYLLTKVFGNKFRSIHQFYNKKYGSVTSIASWLKTKDFKLHLLKLIKKKNSLSKKYLNFKELKILIRSNKNYRFIFWSLFNLEVWYQNNF